MMLTDNKYIVSACKKFNDKVNIGGSLIDRFLVPNDFTPKTSIKKKYDWEDLADTDIKNSSNKIGEIINLAQMLNSLYWDKKTKGDSEEELFELYKDICQLDILSCIEIDRCKKLSPVNAVKELKKIRDKGYFDKGIINRNKEKKNVGIRPYFFKFLDGGKDYKFQKYNCGMDNLEIVVDEEVKRKADYSETIKLYELLSDVDMKFGDRKKVTRMIKIMNRTRNKQRNIWADDEIENKWEKSNEVYLLMLDELKNIKLTKETIYVFLYRINKSLTSDKHQEYKKMGKYIMKVLFDINKTEFLKCFKMKLNRKIYIEECEKGNISLYGKMFKNIEKH